MHNIHVRAKLGIITAGVVFAAGGAIAGVAGTAGASSHKSGPPGPVSPANGGSAQSFLRQVAQVTFPASYANPTSFDISYVDASSQTYYLADRTNNGIDAIDAANNSFGSVIGAGAFVGSNSGTNATSSAQTSACGTGTAGPNGVLTLKIGGVNQLVNAGNARVDGVEGTLSYRLFPRLSVIATAAYTDARLTTPAPLLGLSKAGAPLPLTPRFSSALMANYSFDLTDSVHGMLNVAVRQIGERNSGFAGGAGFNWGSNYKLAAYNVVDVTMTLSSKAGWQVSPYIKNIFDVRGEVTAGTATNQFVPSAPVPVVLSQPRTIGVVIGKSF